MRDSDHIGTVEFKRADVWSNHKFSGKTKAGEKSPAFVYFLLLVVKVSCDLWICNVLCIVVVEPCVCYNARNGLVADVVN